MTKYTILHVHWIVHWKRAKEAAQAHHNWEEAGKAEAVAVAWACLCPCPCPWAVAWALAWAVAGAWLCTFMVTAHASRMVKFMRKTQKTCY